MARYASIITNTNDIDNSLQFDDQDDQVERVITVLASAQYAGWFLVAVLVFIAVASMWYALINAITAFKQQVELETLL